MRNHIDFKGQIIGNHFFKIRFRWYFIIEIIKRMQPFIIGFYGGFYTKSAFRLNAVKPHIQQVLLFVFGADGFYQADMLLHFKTIVFKIDEFH